LRQTKLEPFVKEFLKAKEEGETGKNRHKAKPRYLGTLRYRLELLSGYLPDYMLSITMVGSGPAPHRPTSGIGALIHYDWARAIFFGFKRDKITTPKPGELRIFHSTAQSGKQPKATVTVPSDYKVLSGGARINYSGQGNFLTASFPKDVRTWVARAKQQKVDDIATFATALGYTLVGGGAKVNYSGEGNLLTASYPDFDNNTWKAQHTQQIGSLLTNPCKNVRLIT
jgi:hypothetical protein